VIVLKNRRISLLQAYAVRVGRAKNAAHAERTFANKLAAHWYDEAIAADDFNLPYKEALASYREWQRLERKAIFGDRQLKRVLGIPESPAPRYVMPIGY